MNKRNPDFKIKDTDTQLGAPGNLKNLSEKTADEEYIKLFTQCSDEIGVRLDNFPKYVKLQALTRFLARYELFKKIINVKGSIIECGVFRGFGVMSWANLSAILEPVNFMRGIYGFDTFSGFVSSDSKDTTEFKKPEKGELNSNSFDELNELIKAFDKNRYLGHMEKVKLIRGDAIKTIPAFVNENKHIVVSLLFLDFDLFEPTKIAIENFVPRMPKGAIIVFDEIDHPTWPGETLALIETLGIPKLRIQRFDFDPYIGYAIID